jgi:predicted AAA+ superfamily ATPase
MLGQLQDAGNTTTLAHYLDLLGGAGMVVGLGKYSGERVRQRASSPKLQVLDVGLMTALSGFTFAEAREDRAFWGRLVESAVGAHLHRATAGTRLELHYWRDRSREVDYVLRAGRRVTLLEVKSGRASASLPGVDAFRRAFGPAHALLVGGGGIPLEEFLSTDPERWMA